MQGGGVIQGPNTAAEGSSVEITVGSSITRIEVAYGGPGNTKSFEVPAGGKVTVPVPAGSGPAITVSVGAGLRRKSIVIEVISSTP